MSKYDPKTYPDKLIAARAELSAMLATLAKKHPDILLEDWVLLIITESQTYSKSLCQRVHEAIDENKSQDLPLPTKDSFWKTFYWN